MEDIIAEPQNSITAKSRGDSLEMAVEYILGVAGFKTSRNVFIANYEIDVFAEIGDRDIVLECKNYQNSMLTIRNIIHQWNSKNQIIKAHKVIIVLAGLNISEEDYKLAAEFDIELWNQKDLSDLFALSLKPDVLRNRLLKKIDLRPLTIAEIYRDKITYLVTTPLLSNIIVSDEMVYRNFNKWLRSYIITELQMVETTVLERENLIELFEGTKIKHGILNLVTWKRKESEYWKAVREKLKSTLILSREKQDYYITQMDNLVEEYNSQLRFFQSGDLLLKTRKLISSRLQNALHKGQKCSFKTSSMKNCVNIEFPGRDQVVILITGINEAECNILNWILTSEGTPQTNGSGDIIACKWSCSSLDDATEKTYRIFTEYYEITSNAQLKDTELTL